MLLHRHPAGVVITTSGIDKFYSNGLDLAHMTATPHFFRDAVYALWHRLATFPMPTVAWVNGHAFAGGLMLAMFHDYRAMNPHRGYLCLNELELGIPLAPPMAGVFRQKVSASVLRRMVLEVERFKVRRNDSWRLLRCAVGVVDTFACRRLTLPNRRSMLSGRTWLIGLAV